MRKIAFFDIDGTLTSETDGSIPDSAVSSIRKARENGHLMFINTGRCFQNVEQRFRDIGFDGYVCGCGTNVFCEDNCILHITQSHDITMEILDAARKTEVDLVFESRRVIAIDPTAKLHHPDAIKQLNAFLSRGYIFPTDLTAPDFTCDKFVIWYQNESQLNEFRKVSDGFFECIDRGGTFREFVPFGCSKATGIQTVLDYYNMPLDAAYAFGDSNNDLPMLNYIPNSIAMGNSCPDTIFDLVSYRTSKASQGGIRQALMHFGFI